MVRRCRVRRGARGYRPCQRRLWSLRRCVAGFGRSCAPAGQHGAPCGDHQWFASVKPPSAQASPRWTTSCAPHAPESSGAAPLPGRGRCKPSPLQPRPAAVSSARSRRSSVLSQRSARQSACGAPRRSHAGPRGPPGAS
eukprot:scaffold21812_cov110-Isochrysis_galbana.AAC.15